ncbi:Flagellin [Paraburkholderia ultramafica]|uniref:Flagellin n=1 Tax=Paraburkholderia ultramafica TaxID=1544867 RepID=A0A6S7CS69_9BURK|nr:flagellin [Paraburkholderia ultramafica]CAB3786762.1 Flagellin [Paraburkholderia ultramafica]
MLGINSNINSLVAQQNLNGSQSALSQAITRLSSGKRINSAADDAAGLAISTGMQTQINGLNQGVSNANDGVSMVQTASSGLSQITSSLQRIRQLAVQASSGGLTADNRAALQQEVSQQIQEVNRIASQTQYNGKNILDGSAGSVTFQVGANVGQTVNLNLSQDLSAASVGTGQVQAGALLGSVAVSIDSTGAEWTAGTSTGNEITQVNVLADGKGGYTYTDQNNQQIANSVIEGAAAVLNVSTAGTITAGSGISIANSLTAINANNVAGTAAGTTLGTISGLDLATSSTGVVTDAAAGTPTYPVPSGNITSITVKSDGSTGFQFFDQNGNTLSANAIAAVFDPTTAVAGGTLAQATTPATQFVNVNAKATTQAVSNIDISTTNGANDAMESIDNALTTVNNIQASLGAAQNRFTAIATTQQAQSTDLSQAQSQITDANFAQETANLSKAQVMQQAGISVLSQANSMPQQVLKLLQ